MGERREPRAVPGPLGARERDRRDDRGPAHAEQRAVGAGERDEAPAVGSAAALAIARPLKKTPEYAPASPSGMKRAK